MFIIIFVTSNDIFKESEKLRGITMMDEQPEQFVIKTPDLVFGENLKKIVPKLWNNSLFSDITLVLGIHFGKYS